MDEKQNRLRALIVGNHNLVCQSIVHILRDAGSVDARAASSTDFIRHGPSDVDVAVCVIAPEASLEEIEEVIQDLRDCWSDAKIACLFLDNNDAAMVAAVRAGATGIIDESIALGVSFPVDLLNQLTRVADGEFVCSSQVAHRLTKFHARDNWPSSKEETLTRREHEVLCLLSEGRTNRDIAAQLSLSEHTVRTHLRGIMQKLHVTNRVQAAALAWRGNLSLEMTKEER